MAVDTIAILLSTIAGKVLLDLGALLDGFVEFENRLILAASLDSLQRVGERELDAIDTLLMSAPPSNLRASK